MAEDDVLRAAYMTGKGASSAMEHRLMVGRSRDQISSRARRIGLIGDRAQGPAGSEWTADELEILFEHASRTGDVIGLGEKLPRRTHEGMLAQARRLGLLATKANSYWPPEDIEALRAHIARTNSLEGAQSVLPHRSWLSIRTKARRLGLMKAAG